ncbi:hypothetical protein AGMMS4952_22490 [Spirochaetia bacterium]|nr:hypothetical protein AGMMS4952_22490 [Spirochaetia bacterium]
MIPYAAGSSLTFKADTELFAQWSDPVVLNTFLIYGYDVINSAYINRDDVKRGRPILDSTKVAAAGIIRSEAATNSDYYTASGETITKMLESINAAASAEYKSVGFSGKVSTEFSASSDATKTNHYAKGRGFHVTREDYLYSTAPSTLSSLLDSSFIADINSKTPAQILDTYGTHLLARVYLGGSADFNYTYTGTDMKTIANMSAAIEAGYSMFSTGVSAGAKTENQELVNNSTFKSSSRGGNNTAWPNQAAFIAGYDAWVASVEAKPDLCGVPNLAKDLIPVWDLVKEVNAGKAELIHTEFLERVKERGIALAAFTVPNVAVKQIIEFHVGNFRVADWYRTAWAPITLDLVGLRALGYTKVAFSWTTDWAENTGNPDCTAHVVLDCAANAAGSRNDNWIYYDQVINPGGGLKTVTWEFSAPISTVAERSYIRCAYGYDKHQNGSYYDISGTVKVTVTAQK